METIIHKVVVGSRLHKLNNDNSDYDYRGIFTVPLIEIISPFRRQKNTSWIEGKDDDTSFELINFVKMATSGNPTVLEILWSDMIIESSVLGAILVDQKWHLLDTDRIYKAHLGYSFNQQKKMDLYNPDPIRTPKTICAYIRALRQGTQLLYTGNFDTEYNYPDRDFLLEIKYDYKRSMVGRVSELMQQARQELEEAYTKTTLVLKPNFEWIENFLLSAYNA